MTVDWILQLCAFLFGHNGLRDSSCVSRHGFFHTSSAPCPSTRELCPRPPFQVDLGMNGEWHTCFHANQMNWTLGSQNCQWLETSVVLPVLANVCQGVWQLAAVASMLSTQISRGTATFGLSRRWTERWTKWTQSTNGSVCIRIPVNKLKFYIHKLHIILTAPCILLCSLMTDMKSPKIVGTLI